MIDSANESMINDPAPPAEVTPWVLPSVRKVGLGALIFTETALFTIFVVAYLFYIGKSLAPPYAPDVLHFPLIATLALFSSSVTVVIAERAFHQAALAKFHLWWGVTILLGLFFIGFTAYEWFDLIVREGLTIQSNVFGSTFYSLVGLHAFHVVVGLLLLSLVWILSVLGHVKPDQFERIQMISWYWHFVDAIWVVVLLVVYVISAGLISF
jgi:cytochrome c oxidase subunit 3/cytochrome o ubiquinol oxidase subunit 3